MDIPSTTPITSPTAASVTPTVSPPISSDYTTFLKMMTTQIKNQDPLDPMNADQFAVQLATFSGVEQQTKTNDLLTQQLAQNTQNAMSQMVGWVGKEARVAAPVHFDGTTPVTLSPNPGIGADGVQLVVKDSAGNEVGRSSIPVSTDDYQWHGFKTDGSTLPAGNYTVSLESYQGTTLLGSTPVEYYGKINEIRSTQSGADALLDGGIEVSTALVTALREPPA